MWCELSPQRSEDQWNRRWRRVDTVMPWNWCLITLMVLLKYWQSNETRLTLRLSGDYRITHLMWGMSNFFSFLKRAFIHFQLIVIMPLLYLWPTNKKVWATIWGSLEVNDKWKVCMIHDIYAAQRSLKKFTYTSSSQCDEHISSHL